MLSGLTKASSGDALVLGYSVKNQMHMIRSQMGVCPQHDILFDQLTAREHIQLFAGIKGVSYDRWKILTEERLTAVRLLTVADKLVGTYSGGMRRRLSVILATIGDPSILHLDEPTTGMDPINRRHVWDFIEQYKNGRTIILTTHSMEEAEALGTRIGIMVHGRIRTIGVSSEIKSKLGSGYNISIAVDPSNLAEIQKIVQNISPSSALKDSAAGSLLYYCLHMEEVMMLIKYMESNPQELVKTWGISQTSLEQIFLKIVKANQTNDIVNGEG